MNSYPLIHKPINSSTTLPQVQSIVYGEGKFIRQAGKQYGHVILQLEPNFNRNGCFMLWSVAEGLLPEKYPLYREYLITEHWLEAVYKGLCETITEEVESDYRITRYVPFPYENTNVRIIGGSEHLIDSKSSSFRRAASLALEQAVSQL